MTDKTNAEMEDHEVPMTLDDAKAVFAGGKWSDMAVHRALGVALESEPMTDNERYQEALDEVRAASDALTTARKSLAAAERRAEKARARFNAWTVLVPPVPRPPPARQNRWPTRRPRGEE